MVQISPIVRQATPVIVEQAEGNWILGTDGVRYLDFTSGIGVTSTGHCHPRVVEAARKQIGSVIHAQATTVMHKPLLELTEKLGDYLPENLDSVFYANSGAEAVEGALRLARQATNRPNIIAFQGGFHGRTSGASSITTAGTKFRNSTVPLMGGVVIAPFPYAYRLGMTEDEAVRFALRELDYIFATVTSPHEAAAFIIEPVLGDGGYLPVPVEFLRGIEERARKHDVLVIVDEIQSGVGRTGEFWAHTRAGITPDILITAKGIASGFPISAIAASTELMAKGLPGSQGGTYGGNAVAAAAAIETLNVIKDEGLVQNAAERGAQLQAGLKRLQERFPVIGDVRGLGLMQAIEFTGDDGEADAATAAAVQQGAVSEELLLLPCGPLGNVIRIVPALTVNAEEVELAIERLERTLEKVTSAAAVK
ncbi:aspartate aminotransferase family protein [Pseudoclavibacter terrae]|uniref:(S)-3-amino-2-methylpropionate transaminase n=1 Tax=Pseudoclavibacter terrae TaxID=1530195 RepID=A0A7J5AXD8_9MICO|nr:aminotransferase class III-fold pyridoxal phosphate-dependent enzyme [Pseudoclavibacter terrae]KAB1636108.1 aminotransferase class III-fold pyridoxal phosphate-dependent enzyme [Pseudoclavibacter terrae]